MSNEQQRAEMAENTVLTNTIERLKASKAQGEDEGFTSGRGCGASWAKRHAEYKELLLIDSETPAFFDAPASGPNDAYSDAEYLFKVIFGKDEFTREASAEFWEGCLGAEHPNHHELEGFCQGAIDVWNQVQEQVDA